MNDVDCSILVLTCDKNVSLMNIFMSFFWSNWKDCPFRVYLGFENIKPEYSKSIILNSDETKWGKRTLGYLKTLKTKYVMIILDDFIVEKQVDTESIKRYISYMRNDGDIVSIAIADIYDKNNSATEYGELVKRPKKANYLLNLQACLWHRETLISLMRENENPWQTELFGSIRARKLKDKQFLCLESDEVSPYKYGRGWLMVRGIWNGNEIKRLGLQKYSDDIFDGRDIMYSNLMHIKLATRVNRRIQIELRKLLSNLNIYI